MQGKPRYPSKHEQDKIMEDGKKKLEIEYKNVWMGTKPNEGRPSVLEYHILQDVYDSRGVHKDDIANLLKNHHN